MKAYLSVKQVVQRLNGAVSAKLVYKLIAQGKLRANRATGKVLVEEQSLIELMEGTATDNRHPKKQRKTARATAPEVDLW